MAYVLSCHPEPCDPDARPGARRCPGTSCPWIYCEQNASLLHLSRREHGSRQGRQRTRTSSGVTEARYSTATRRRARLAGASNANNANRRLCARGRGAAPGGRPGLSPCAPARARPRSALLTTIPSWWRRAVDALHRPAPKGRGVMPIRVRYLSSELSPRYHHSMHNGIRRGPWHSQTCPCRVNLICFRGLSDCWTSRFPAHAPSLARCHTPARNPYSPRLAQKRFQGRAPQLPLQFRACLSLVFRSRSRNSGSVGRPS